MKIPEKTLDEFINKKEFVRRYPELFTPKQLDWIVRIRHANGFDKAVRKIGRRKLLIHIPTATAWIDSQSA